MDKPEFVTLKEAFALRKWPRRALLVVTRRELARMTEGLTVKKSEGADRLGGLKFTPGPGGWYTANYFCPRQSSAGSICTASPVLQDGQLLFGSECVCESYEEPEREIVVDKNEPCTIKLPDARSRLTCVQGTCPTPCRQPPEGILAVWGEFWWRCACRRRRGSDMTIN